LFLVYSETQTLDYMELHTMTTSAATVGKIAPIALPAVILIFIGCSGKSAQIPLYTWLPDAMAGPTPVSALIHAATMVTSGVYLLARLNGLVTLAYEAMLVIAVVGAVTAFFAASIALVQNDIKKVLAYSTVSQLGYMFLAIGVGSFVGAVFHLMTHAFFKALLFLGSGSVIHSMGGEQDIRKMGGLHKYMPITSITFAIACVAIAGVPFVASGFFSKDLILWGAVSNVHIFQVAGLENMNIAALLVPGVDAAGMMPTEEATKAYAAVVAGEPLGVALGSRIVYAIVAFLGFATALMTAFYMWRLYFLTFLGECRADEETKSHLHESPPTMTIPLIVLGVLSVIGGWTGWPHMIAYAAGDKAKKAMLAFEYWLEPVFDVSMNTRILNHFGAHPTVPETISMVASIILAGTGIGLAYFFYLKRPNIPKTIADSAGRLYTLLSNKYYVDEGYDYVVRGSINFGKAQYLFDRYIVDGLIVNGFGFLASSIGGAMRHLQSGDVQRYATYIVLAVVLALAVLL
jgi:NADH-quinone oxidoreductase subunit L